jgi:hypothetical protein
MKPEFIDNFLGKKEFDSLQALMMGNEFLWRYSNSVDSMLEKVNENKFQFVHVFYFSPAPCSQYFENLTPIFEIIQPISLVRIKANLLTKTPNIIENTFHIDTGDMSEEKQKQITTAIYYMNTNNGYTIFEDGLIVESVANRMVFFSSNMKHTGTSCTDEKTRVIINFNYFK